MAVIYIALLLVLRLFGKREVGQFTLFDLVFVLLVANAVQPAMTGPDSSLLGGVIVIVSLVGLNFLIGRVQNLPYFKKVLAAPPTVIIRDGKYLQNAKRLVSGDRVLEDRKAVGRESLDTRRRGLRR